MKQIIYGINPIIEALSNKNVIITEVIAQDEKDNKRVHQILRMAAEKSIPVRYARKEELLSLCNKNHQGIVAVISNFAYKDFDELLLELNENKSANLLFLDCIEDPHNLGALIRSACAFNFDGVVIQDKRSAPVTASVIKTSAGAVFHIPVCIVTNINDAIHLVKNSGFWVVGMTITAEKNIYELKMDARTALVIGNEEHGMRNLVSKNCDFLVKIPISKNINSLNASVAGACAMYEIVRQRNPI